MFLEKTKISRYQLPYTCSKIQVIQVLGY